MANDIAPIRRDIWADEDFRDLPMASQWLYLHVVSSASLSYCGVADWRPARIAALTSDLGALDVERAAVDLEGAYYLIIDRDTEEALVRSWVKHDGLMDKWNMAAAVARTYGEVASRVLRGVIVHELHRLKDAEPGLRGWARDDVERVLRKPRIAPPDALPKVLRNPAVWPSESPNGSPSEWGSESPNGSPSESPSEWGSPTTSTSTSTYTPLISTDPEVTSPAAGARAALRARRVTS